MAEPRRPRQRGEGADPDDAEALLARAARRLEANPAFLASILAAYRAERRIGEPELAAELGCRPGDLVRLALCRAPRPGAQFRADLAAAAEHVGADLDRLIGIVRRVEALAAFRAVGRAGILLAARERDAADDAPRPNRPAPP